MTGLPGKSQRELSVYKDVLLDLVMFKPIARITWAADVISELIFILLFQALSLSYSLYISLILKMVLFFFTT